MATTLTAVLLASLFGSLHCAGMCGALVAFAVGSTERQSLALRATLQSAYHGGRLVGYAAIGAIGGAIGAAVDFGGSMVGLHRAAALLAGGMMIAVGLIAVARYRGMRLPNLPLSGRLKSVLTVGQRAAMGLRPFPRALAVGLLTSLLPCGWLYAFAVVAAGTASVAWGAAVMTAFWLGTVPILAVLGVGVQTLSGTLGRRVPLFTALAIVALGLYTVAGRLAIPTDALQPSAAASDGNTLEQVEAVGREKPPCCK